MRKLFQNFRKSESGATLVEYGVALILAIVLGGGALSLLAGDVGAQMDSSCDAFNFDGRDATIDCGNNGPAAAAG